MARDPVVTGAAPVAAEERAGIAAALRDRRGAWLVFAGAVFFAFPHEVPGAWALGLPAVIDLGLVLAWVVPAALVLAIEGLSPRTGARAALVASFVVHTVFYYWFMVVTVVYAGMPFTTDMHGRSSRWRCFCRSFPT